MKHCSAIDQPLRPSCRARWCSSWLARSSVAASAQKPQGEYSKLLIIAIRLAVAGRAGDAHLPPGAGLRVETACRVHRQERPHPDFRQWWGRLVAVSTSAPGGTRTPNLLIRSQMLYPLSYGRTDPAGPESSIASHGGGRKSRTSDHGRDLAHGPPSCRRSPLVHARTAADVAKGPERWNINDPGLSS